MKYEEALDLIQPNLDSKGLIIHNVEQWGGGDTAQREGMWAYGLALAFPLHLDEIRKNFERSLELLEVASARGNYVRHPRVPGAPEWYDDPNDFSRDQSIPLVAAMGRLGIGDHLSEFAYETWKRGMRAQNGDPWWWPYYIGFWIRALVESGLARMGVVDRLFVWLGDFTLIFASIFSVVHSHIDKTHADDLNFIIILLQSRFHDTIFARIARKIFSRFRAKVDGTQESWGPASALESYFFSSQSAKISGAPRIDLLYKLGGIIKKLVE